MSRRTDILSGTFRGEESKVAQNRHKTIGNQVILIPKILDSELTYPVYMSNQKYLLNTKIFL